MASFRSSTGTLLKASATELNLLDSATAATVTTVVAADSVVLNDADVGMKQVAMTDLVTHFDGSSTLNVYTPTAQNGTQTYTSIPNSSGDTVLVHVNGVLLASDDVTKPSSTSVRFPAITADDITILVISKLSTLDSATVRIERPVYASGGYSISHGSTDRILAYINGILLADTDVVADPSANTVTLAAAASGDEITIVIYSTLLNTAPTTMTVDTPTAVVGSTYYNITGGINSGDDVFVHVNGILYDDSDITQKDYVNNRIQFSCTSTADNITIQTVRAIETNSHTVLRNHRFVSSSSTPPAAGSVDFPVPHGAGDTINAYVNGILLDSANVISNATTNIVALSCEDSSDEVLIQVIGAINTNQHQTLRIHRPTAVASSNAYTGIAHSTADTVLVYINGVLLNNTATSPNGVTTSPAASTVTFTATNVADEITILVIGMVNTNEHASVRTYYPTAINGTPVIASGYDVIHDSADKIFVYRNGVLLDDGDVTSDSSLNKITFAGITADEITIQVIGMLTTSGIAEYAPTIVAGSNQVYGNINHSTADIVNVYLNGVLLDAADYSTSPSGNSVTVIGATTAGDVLKIQVIGAITSVNAIDTLTSHGGSIIPSTTTTYDLGSSTKAWNNLYTADLHLSNEGAGGNSIDGTVGNWSIQEGNENLFLLNNSNGKKYKFKLQEVI